jgi:uncharacterized protein (UPF0332 family)
MNKYELEVKRVYTSMFRLIDTLIPQLPDEHKTIGSDFGSLYMKCGDIREGIDKLLSMPMEEKNAGDIAIQLYYLKAMLEDMARFNADLGEPIEKCAELLCDLGEDED